ncbi:alpha/beta fold hydrolase [Rhizobium sp. AAP43]|uniref:alpha/beta fold hydrolase n=1 Tax=Rhizobium sp. AAP43 TaxID=1523420 RepID=UPI0006B8A3ED|nr:alpha/beta fold hydrolase [Rhizobium sp. AAP43]KPF45564.1 hypothetical protein IP76_08480 [Rhizobium sp. AAP43]
MTLFAEERHLSSAKPPLVLLHGFGGIGALWRPVTDRLFAEQPLLIYDLPGHGRSLESEGIRHAGVMAKAILADLEKRDIGRFHLCGHSLGGAVASLIAGRAGTRVSSLTLLSPGGFGPEINAVALRRYGLAETVAELSGAIIGMMAPGFEPCKSDLGRLADARHRPGATDRLMQILASFLVERDGGVGQGTLPLAAFTDLDVPTRIVWGLEDPILPVLQAEHAWDGAEIIRIAGVGHMLIEEAPGVVAAVLGKALSSG